MVFLVVSVISSVENVPITISVDSSRPLALYEAPATYRRDSRGRPFKSIIVTSRPFGFDVASNDIRQKKTPLTTTTARPSKVTRIFSAILFDLLGFLSSKFDQISVF